MQRIVGLRHVASKGPVGMHAYRLQARCASKKSRIPPTGQKQPPTLSQKQPPPPSSLAKRTIPKRKQPSPSDSSPQASTSFSPPPPTWTPPPPPPKQRVRKWQAIPLVLASVMAFFISFYGVKLYKAAQKLPRNPNIQDLAEQKDVSDRYEYTADTFDSEVSMSEILAGINRMRKKLARMCTGHVLEVSCGTGRNLGYYDIGKDGRVESLTFIDLSPQMLDICRKKWNAFHGYDIKDLRQDLIVRFLAGSALGPMPLAPTSPLPKKYDTVIQTMGVCSTPSPVELLVNMAKHLDVENPEAKILLLEHGRSYRQWLNRILDGAAEDHAEIHGCWFNRDIGAVVADAAAKAGLEVVREKRHNFGTIWLFELKPKHNTLKASS